jgi:hypothetical protein
MTISRKNESRIYIGAFVLIGLITLIMCSYFEGRTDEALSESHDMDQEVENAIAERDYWYGKYESLSHEADAVTVLAAEEKFEENRQ